MSLIIKVSSAGEQTLENTAGKVLTVKDGRIESLDGQTYYDPAKDAVFQVGNGQFVLDGKQTQIRMTDDSGNVKLLMGKKTGAF